MTAGREADAVVLGAGAAGLATAATLRRQGVETVVLERASQPGAAWDGRYDGLRLNTVRWMSDLPGFRMPRRFGRWPRREEWAEYLRRYAEVNELTVCTETTASRVVRGGDGWRVETSGGAFDAPAVVIATGHDHTAVIPEWPGREGFSAELLHSAEYRSPAPFVDKDVLVVGSGNSATEIATLLAAGGAGRVRIAIRTAPLILRREYVGMPATPWSVPARLLPDAALDRIGWAMQDALFGDLAPYGLPRSPKPLSRMKHTYYSPPMDSGFVDAVKRGQIEVVGPVQGFDGPDVVLASDQRVRPDAVIAATGYETGLQALVGSLGVVRDDGEPAVRGGGTAPHARGIYFAGFRFGLLALLPYLERDAKDIAAAVTGRRTVRPMMALIDGLGERLRHQKTRAADGAIDGERRAGTQTRPGASTTS